MEITTRSFTIKDSLIVDYMLRNRVEHLRFLANIDGDDDCMVVEFPDYKNELVLSRQWMRVNYGKKKVTVRTPAFLRPYIGKDVKVYRDKIFEGNFEAFRIKPIGFKIKEKLLKSGRKASINVPYFSKSGYCVIPDIYVSKKVGHKLLGSKISFNRTDNLVLEDGDIYCRIFKYDKSEIGMFVYKLSICTNGVRARIKKFSERVSALGKDITKFQYQHTFHDEDANYDLVVFKEMVKNEEP